MSRGARHMSPKKQALAKKLADKRKAARDAAIVAKGVPKRKGVLDTPSRVEARRKEYYEAKDRIASRGDDAKAVEKERLRIAKELQDHRAEKLRAKSKKAKPAAPANVDLLDELELESQEGFGEGPGGRPGSPEFRAAVKGKSEAGKKKMLAKTQGRRLAEAEAEGRKPEWWEVPGAQKRAKGKRPSLPKNWRKLAYNHPDRVAFREWFSKGRKSKAVAKGKAKAPATKGVPRGKASEAADKRALETRIAMKQRNNEPIPASWKKKLKDLDTRLGVEKAGRRLRGTVLVGSEEEKRQKAKIKDATASTRELMKTISPQARARYAKGKDISETLSEQAEHKARQGRVAAATAKRTAQDKIAAIKARKAELQAKLKRQKEERQRLTATQTATPKGE